MICTHVVRSKEAHTPVTNHPGLLHAAKCDELTQQCEGMYYIGPQ